MRNKYNNLLKYIYEYSEKIHCKETINGLFRSILEPISQNQKVEACILFRILNKDDKISAMKRLAFSNVKIYDFSKIPLEIGINNCEKDDIWGDTEFLIVLEGRYSACLIWDYSDSEVKNRSRICLLYNSKTINEIAKLICNNSKEDFSELLKKYMPDRRENTLLNKSIQAISNVLNDKNEDVLFSENEKTSFEKDNESVQTAKFITEKAKFISHEIKNHLSIINLYSKIMQKRLELLNGDEENKLSVNNAIINVANASENISYLISDLRCMSGVYKAETDLKVIVLSAVELTKVRVERENAVIELDNIQNTPIKADKVRVECAITNIIFNALDANAKKIIVRIQGNKILIENNGNVIPEEIQGKIFEENFTTKEKGNGLGLYFCRNELRQTGGDINLIKSQINKTVFEITV